MKKFIAWLLVVAMCMPLGACGEPEEKSPAELRQEGVAIMEERIIQWNSVSADIWYTGEYDPQWPTGPCYLVEARCNSTQEQYGDMYRTLVFAARKDIGFDKHSKAAAMVAPYGIGVVFAFMDGYGNFVCGIDANGNPFQ